MKPPRCYCCHVELGSAWEQRARVCDECVRIALRPELYADRSDIDAALVRRKVESAVTRMIARERTISA